MGDQTLIKQVSFLYLAVFILFILRDFRATQFLRFEMYDIERVTYICYIGRDLGRYLADKAVVCDGTERRRKRSPRTI